jgi:hypothetical protein
MLYNADDFVTHLLAISITNILYNVYLIDNFLVKDNNTKSRLIASLLYKHYNSVHEV